MKLETKLIAALVAASVCVSGSLIADDKEKVNEPAGAEVQVDTSDDGVEAQSEIQVDEPAGAETDKPEEKFVKKAAESSMAEVKIGELAAQQAESSSVKQLGDKLARDHQEAHDKLKEIAQRKNITLSEELKDKHQEKLEKMGELSGQEFDKEFLKYAIEDHKKDIKEFEKQAQEGEDPSIRSFASETLPTLREHLRIAQMLQDNPRADIPELREPAGAQPETEQEEPPSLEPQPEEPQQDDAGPAPLPGVDDTNVQP